MPAPDINKIPVNSRLGSGGILVTVFYEGMDFLTVGYWVSNDFYMQGQPLT